MSTHTASALVAFVLALLGYGHFRVGLTRTASMEGLVAFRWAFLALTVLTGVALLVAVVGDAIDAYRWRKINR